MRRIRFGILAVLLMLTILAACSGVYSDEYYTAYKIKPLGDIIFEVHLGTPLPSLESWPSYDALIEARELPVYPFQELTFNVGEPLNVWHASVSPFPREGMRYPSYDTINTIFPTIDLSSLRVQTHFSDGILSQIDVTQDNDIFIIVGIGDIRDARLVIFDSSFVPEITYVHGVPVRAFMFQYSGLGLLDTYWFQADFAMGSIVYRIRFIDTKENGQECMTELVNKLIWGGTEGLHSVFEIVVPERSYN